MLTKEPWRDPVKSMVGELPDAADVTENGIAHDRISITSGRVAVGDPGELISPV